MKIQHFAAVAALALLAACNKPAAEAEAPAAAPAAVEAEAAAPSVPAGVYKLDPTHAFMTWTISHIGFSNYSAKFTKYDVTITLDPADLSKSKVVASIDPRSVRTDYPADYKGTHPQTGFNSWDEDIANAGDKLNAGKFPTITFTSTSVQPTGARTAKVTGDLTFLGVTKPVTLDATVIGGAERHPMTGAPVVGFNAVGKFNRSDFGMAKGPLGDEVTFRFDGEFQGAAPAAAPAA